MSSLRHRVLSQGSESADHGDSCPSSDCTHQSALIDLKRGPQGLWLDEPHEDGNCRPFVYGVVSDDAGTIYAAFCTDGWYGPARATEDKAQADVPRRHRDSPLRPSLREERVRQVLVRLTKNKRLTDEQVLQLDRQVILDLRDHIRTEHEREAATGTADRMLDRVLENLAELVKDREDLLRHLLVIVSAYWSHVTEEHPARAGSVEDYLRKLVDRIERSS